VAHPSESLRERWVRRARVHLSFVRVLLPQFWASIALFLGVNSFGAYVIWREADPHPTWAHALYSALTLTFFEISESYPERGGVLIQIVYFALPAVGLLLIAESLVRFGVAVFNRKHMSEEWHMALASTYTDHVVVAGLGHIGRRVAAQLARTERLVCIEMARKTEGGAPLPEDVAIIPGDATHPDVLEKANVAKARAILCLTDNDMANLEVALSARELNPKIRVVLRMFNEKLGQRLVEQFKFEAVHSTSALAAPSFVSALYHSRVLQTIQVGEGKVVHMAEVVVAETSPLSGHTILEVERLGGISVVMHQTAGRDDLLPSADARVLASDRLYVLCELGKLDVFDRLATGRS
jgi:voltage-gated potassium channel